MPTIAKVLGIEEIYNTFTTKYINAVPHTCSMEDKIFPTGTEVFDTLLHGYEGGVLAAIYGPSGTGKTTVCLLAAIATIRAGKKVIFVDTEGGFSTIRFQQLVHEENITQYLEKIFLMKPMTFADQGKTVSRLRELVNEQIGLVIVDSVSMLYRIELGKHEGVKGVNSDLGLQLFYLNTIARQWNIPVLMTSQVYADFEEKDKVKMVGGDIIKYGAKCLIELEKYRTLRKATIMKHRSLPEQKAVVFEIITNGFQLFEQPVKETEPLKPVQRKSVSEEIATRFPELKDKKEFEEAGNVP
jgi:DNA repair protein RadB